MNDEQWDLARFTLEAVKVRNIWASYSSEQKSRLQLSALIDHFPTEYRTPALALLQSGYDANELERHKMDLEHSEREAQVARESERLSREWKREGRAFWTGVGLLLLALAVSAIIAPTSSATSLVLRVMLGLSVALIIAFLPGLFSLDSKIQAGAAKLVIRATGGFAGFIVIYLFDPGWFSRIFSR
jgi:hypothetical protein